MSFDLNLYPREGKPPLQREAFFAYFQGERYQHEGDTINYSNADTGVYFHFTWYEGETEVEEPNRKDDAYRTQPHVYFNMNFFRPHTFGLEAARILGPLVRRFDLVVDDQQSEGMGQGDYSEEGFLRSWNAGNRFAARAFGQLNNIGAGSLRLPTAINRSLWAWNFDREMIGEDLWDLDDIDVYVPRIWFYREDGQAKSFTLFPNLVPTAVPKVDYVLILRNELSAPYEEQSQETPTWVRWEELVAAAPGFEVRGGEAEDEDWPHLILYSEDYRNKESPPESLARWVIGLPDWPGKPDQVTPDQILDAELVAAT